MAILYYDNRTGNNDWATIGNWWQDSDYTIQSTNLPTLNDDVVMIRSCTQNSQSGITPLPEVSTLRYEPTTTTITLTIPIKVNNGAIFIGRRGTSFASRLSSTIVGNVSFYRNSTTTGSFPTVSGNAYFYDNTTTNGNFVVHGNLECYDTANVYGVINGNAVFNNNSTNNALIRGNVVFNDGSRNFSSIVGNTIFNHASFGIPSPINSGFVPYSGMVTYQNRTQFPILIGVNGSNLLGII